MDRGDSLVRQAIRKRLEACFPRPLRPPLAELRRTQWSTKFERLQRNRLLIGAFRYSTVAEQKLSSNRFDNIGSAISRLEKYLQTGNQEHLVDVANLCMVEFMCPSHPAPHFSPEDDGEHVRPVGERKCI